jgi:catechol O-methyltransferase
MKENTNRKGNPFFRKSFLSMLFRMPKLLKTWQVGDGREEKLAQKVLSTARVGDPHDAIRVIDEFAWGESFLMNVGDEKGAILDRALTKAAPQTILEVGTYCGYSALRMAVAAPQAHITSIEFNEANKAIADRILTHAGVANRVTVVHGTLGDEGKTIGLLNRAHGFGPGKVDFVFIDHDKKYYLSDLKLILNEGWLHKGTIVVADNIKFPGAPDYQAYMDTEEGRTWRTQAHETLVEYQSLIKDRVLVSEYIG